MLTRRRILMVADDPDQSTLFTLVLERAGYDIDAVSDGQTALAHLAAVQYDLLLTDYMLPDTNGDIIIRTIQRYRWPVKTVLMSNHVDVLHFARACAADGCYRKDDLASLLTVLAEVLPPVAESEQKAVSSGSEQWQ